VWDSRKLLGSLFPALDRRKPNLEDFARVAKAREIMTGAGIRLRLLTTVVHYLIARLPSRDRAAAMRHWGFSGTESKSANELPSEAHKFRNLLQGRKMEAPEEAYRLLVQTSPALIAFVLTEWSTSGAAMRIRNYLTKWHPLRLSLPVAELSALGVPNGPKFDEVLEKFFVMQLRGRVRDPEERPKILKKLAGIKDESSKKPKPDKNRRKEKGAEGVAPTPIQETGPAPRVKTNDDRKAETAPPPAKKKGDDGTTAGRKKKAEKKHVKKRNNVKAARIVSAPKRRGSKLSTREKSRRLAPGKKQQKAKTKTKNQKTKNGKRHRRSR
jgi:hypothetical protein